jgi:hypothetical protein
VIQFEEARAEWKPRKEYDQRMNRRSFLSALAATPAALVIAHAGLQFAESQRRIWAWVFGEVHAGRMTMSGA